MTREPPEQSDNDERAALARALVAVARQDRDALREVYARTSRKLFGLCMRIFGDRAEAEDAMHDIYLTVWHRAGSFDPARGNPAAWIATLARNRAIDILRRSARRPSGPIELASNVEDEAPNAEARLLQKDGEAQIDRCMDTLAKSDAAMIRTAFFEGVTYADVAARSSLPLATVKSRIRRALIRLRTCLS